MTRFDIAAHRPVPKNIPAPEPGPTPYELGQIFLDCLAVIKKMPLTHEQFAALYEAVTSRGVEFVRPLDLSYRDPQGRAITAQRAQALLQETTAEAFARLEPYIQEPRHVSA